MDILNYVIGGLGLVGIVFGLTCYRELRKWASLCNHSRIVIAYKRRVKAQHPLTEYIKWIHSLNDDEATSGRVIYVLGGTTIAVTKTTKPPNKLQEFIAHHRKSDQATNLKPGNWDAKDETKRETAGHR